MGKDITIEICSDGAAAALEAFRCGADRVELCRDLSTGGLTPSHEDIAAVTAAKGDRAVNVLIRPREGDFVYDGKEIGEMLEDIRFCAGNGVDGVVIGALKDDGSVDLDTVRKLADTAHGLGMSVTFHRAIDCAADIFAALEDAISAGAERVLSSGGRATAYEGRQTLAAMVEQAAGRTSVMPGSGVTGENARTIIEETGAVEIHGSRTGIIAGLRKN